MKSQEAESMENGIVTRISTYSVTETLDRLEAALGQKGIKIFARIDQQAEAINAGLTLRPTQLLVFGNPQAGTPLMTAFPALALDLPLKALAWETEGGEVQLLTNSPVYLQSRYGLPQPPFGAMEAFFDAAISTLSP
jgi:uncharacterized protein (DUF302 family)